MNKPLKVATKRERKRTDRGRIDWLEKEAFGGALVSDDNGHWAMVFDGFQNAVCGKEPPSVESIFWIEEKEKWKDSVRDAIDRAIEEGN